MLLHSNVLTCKFILTVLIIVFWTFSVKIIVRIMRGSRVSADVDISRLILI
jgi:hypothetical protein